ncbi:MAG: DUF4286 family protein [Bacteroidetes bacterium]|jgi:hypothetical protein|nr:DUF4286 family protein [Bacteroidota bacterium]
MRMYNVTVHVEASIETTWLDYMMNRHIPDVMNTGCFIEARISKLESDEDRGGLTFSIQYGAESKEKLREYQQNFAPTLQAEHLQKFGQKCLAFRTEMDVLAKFVSNSNEHD